MYEGKKVLIITVCTNFMAEMAGLRDGTNSAVVKWRTEIQRYKTLTTKWKVGSCLIRLLF